ncbi:Core trichothecene cluster (CTC) protein 14 [Beauveria bassiana]|nr:Core trichothecene cluster (CTC) protein 14 [Beauveria bassiana]
MIGSAVLLLSAASLGAAAPQAKPVEATGQDLIINGLKLYPEKCVVYSGELTVPGKEQRTVKNPLLCSQLYESNVAIVDKEKKDIAGTIDFEGLTRDPVYHASGVLVEGEFLWTSINTGAAFESFGENINGINYAIKYDLQNHKEVWRVDVTTPANGKFGGTQDFAVDTSGNTFVVGTYPGHIIKITPDGKTASLWNSSNSTKSTQTGYTGIVSKGDILLVTNEQNGGEVLRFDSRDEKGNPTVVDTGSKKLNKGLDGAALVNIGSNEYLLVATEDGLKTVAPADEKWEKAEILEPTEPIKSNDVNGTITIALQVEEKIYAIIEYFGDNRPGSDGGLSGDREKWPFQDITSQVTALTKSDRKPQCSRGGIARVRY